MTNKLRRGGHPVAEIRRRAACDWNSEKVVMINIIIVIIATTIIIIMIFVASVFADSLDLTIIFCGASGQPRRVPSGGKARPDCFSFDHLSF